MLIEKARELGITLAETPEYARMCAARKAVDENEAVNSMLAEFTDKRERLMKSLSDNGAAQALELTNDLERLKQQLDENPMMTELIASESAFKELISSVNREISACIGLSANESCSGNCSTCSGCKH